MQETATKAELERCKCDVDELRRQLDTSRTDYEALDKRMKQQQTQIALQRSHVKKQLTDQHKRSTSN